MSFSEYNYACTTSTDFDIYVHQKRNPDKEAVVVCISVGEVANNPLFGTIDGFDITNDAHAEAKKDFNPSIYFREEMEVNKLTVWANNALFKQDQLQQRMAWALYQIIPIGMPFTKSYLNTEVSL